jgi:hypothetical protein
VFEYFYGSLGTIKSNRRFQLIRLNLLFYSVCLLLFLAIPIEETFFVVEDKKRQKKIIKKTKSLFFAFNVNGRPT